MRKRLVLEQLASALGYKAHGYLRGIESGKKIPTAEFVLRMARYFAVSTNALMRDEVDLSYRA